MRAGLSQSPPKEVPRRYLRQNRLAGLERHNGQRARPSSVGRCADRREIPCSECASSTELIWTVPSLWCVVLAKTTELYVQPDSRMAGPAGPHCRQTGRPQGGLPFYIDTKVSLTVPSAWSPPLVVVSRMVQ